MGELSKVLLKTMDESETKYSHEQIKLSEENSEDMTTLLNQQIHVVKPLLGAVNKTLEDAEYNERLLQKT